MEDKSKLSEEARAIRAKYLREWRKRNPGKTEQYTAAYWERKAAEAEKQPATVE